MGASKVPGWPVTSMLDVDRFVLAHESAIRLGCFAAVLVAVGLWEAALPRRARLLPRRARWPANLGLVALNTLAVWLVFPVTPEGFAAQTAGNHHGLFALVALPAWLAIVLAVMVLDFVIWLQHVMVHAVPLLWRLHRVHHADPDYDVTTGSRFHPIEIVLSMLIKLGTIWVLGAPALAVLVFELLLNATAMFNHGNQRLPRAVDRWLRWLVVTPDMHRVHHSVEEDETNSNFGFNLPWWDRLFGTYRDQPRAGHQAMVIGIHGHTDPREVARLPGMLALPFRADRAVP